MVIINYVKKLLFFWGIIFFPSVILFLTFFICIDGLGVNLVFVLLAAYIISVWWIIFFVMKKISALWILPVSFVVSFLCVYLYEFLNPENELQFLMTLIVSIFYSAPMTLISLITVLIASYKKTSGDPV